MNKRKYVIIILLCMAAWLQAQDSVKAFDEFFVTGMKKIEGVCSGEGGLSGNTP